MRLPKWLWIIIGLFLVFLGLSIWVQATSENSFSKGVLEWAVSWSTFFGTALAAIAVFTAIATFVEENRKHRNDAKLKIRVWAYSHFAEAFGFISALLESKDTNTNKRSIDEIIEIFTSSFNDFAEIEMCAESIGNDMVDLVDELKRIVFAILPVLNDVSNLYGNELAAKRTELLELKKKATGYLKKIHEYKV